MSLLIEDALERGILISHENNDVTGPLKLTLENYGYKNISIASTGLETITTIKGKGESVYILIIHLRLLDMSAFKVIKELNDEHPHPLGVIIVTGGGDYESVKKFFDSRTDKIIPLGYIEQPQNIEEISRTVSNGLKAMHKKRKCLIQLSVNEFHDQFEHIQRQLREMNSSLINRDAFDNLSLKVSEMNAKSLDRSSFDKMSIMVSEIRNNQTSLVKQIGKNVLSILIVGFAVIAFMFFDIGRLIKEITSALP